MCSCLSSFRQLLDSREVDLEKAGEARLPLAIFSGGEKPAIGWNPFIHPSLTGYYMYCIL